LVRTVSVLGFTLLTGGSMSKYVPLQTVPVGTKIRSAAGPEAVLDFLGVGSAYVIISKQRSREFDTPFGRQAFSYTEKEVVTWSLNSPVEVIQ
jgi:hypothetical protein